MSGFLPYVWVPALMVGIALGVWFGTKTSDAYLDDEGFKRGLRCGRAEALEVAEAALAAPSEGGTSRSIVGRAIVRKLRALAEGTDDAS